MSELSDLLNARLPILNLQNVEIPSLRWESSGEGENEKIILHCPASTKYVDENGCEISYVQLKELIRAILKYLQTLKVIESLTIEDEKSICLKFKKSNQPTPLFPLHPQNLTRDAYKQAFSQQAVSKGAGDQKSGEQKGVKRKLSEFERKSEDGAETGDEATAVGPPRKRAKFDESTTFSMSSTSPVSFKPIFSPVFNSKDKNYKELCTALNILGIDGQSPQQRLVAIKRVATALEAKDCDPNPAPGSDVLVLGRICKMDATAEILGLIGKMFKYGAKVDAKTSDGTALMHACNVDKPVNNLEAIKFLISEGASLITADGVKAIEIVKNNLERYKDRADMVKYLRERLEFLEGIQTQQLAANKYKTLGDAVRITGHIQALREDGVLESKEYEPVVLQLIGKCFVKSIVTTVLKMDSAEFDKHYQSLGQYILDYNFRKNPLPNFEMLHFFVNKLVAATTPAHTPAALIRGAKFTPITEPELMPILENETSDAQSMHVFNLNRMLNTEVMKVKRPELLRIFSEVAHKMKELNQKAAIGAGEVKTETFEHEEFSTLKAAAAAVKAQQEIYQSNRARAAIPAHRSMSLG